MPAHSPVGAKIYVPMAGLLTCPSLLRLLKTEVSMTLCNSRLLSGPTAAGTVPDFDRIPFSSLRYTHKATIFAAKLYKIFVSAKYWLRL